MHTQIFSVGLSFTLGIAAAFAAPTISVQPISQATMFGSNVTFSIAASGSGPVTFQWLRGRTSLVGKTNALLFIVAASASDEGDYNAIASDNSGSITSQVAWLQIVSGFTRVTNSGLPQAGQPLGAAWGDFNNDGWVDLFLATSSYSIYTNRGDGTLVSLTNRLFGDDSGGRRIGCAWGDYDNDGNLDLAIAPNANGSLYLFHNLGNGQQFARVVTNIFDGPGKQMLSTAWGDYDNDGFLDLFVPVSIAGGSLNDLLFHNNGDGTFSKVTNGVVVSDGVPSQSGIWGDYDNDGDVDLFATHLSGGRSALYRNDSGTNFAKINAEPFASESGSAGGCIWADFDNDGDLDLFIYWQLEGEEVAAWLNSMGVTGIILKYRVPRRPDEPKGEPASRPLQDAQRAISLVRSRAKEWGIDPQRIGIVGFSAGGHLAIATATSFEKRTYQPIDDVDKISCRPDFAIPVYSGYLKAKDKDELAPGLRIPTNTPPFFLVHGGDDIISPPEHSVLMYLALKRAGIPAELHVYANTAHDFGVRTNNHPYSKWTARCADWLRESGFLHGESR